MPTWIHFHYLTVWPLTHIQRRLNINLHPSCARWLDGGARSGTRPREHARPVFPGDYPTCPRTQASRAPPDPALSYVCGFLSSRPLEICVGRARQWNARSRSARFAAPECTADVDDKMWLSEAFAAIVGSCFVVFITRRKDEEVFCAQTRLLWSSRHLFFVRMKTQHRVSTWNKFIFPWSWWDSSCWHIFPRLVLLFSGIILTCFPLFQI